MNSLFALTRSLIDIESITGNEAPVAEFLEEYLRPLVARHGGTLERMDVEPRRFNVFATWDDPVVTLSTHLDTVPPFFASSEDRDTIRGRGACDVKGIIAAMIAAVERLLADGVRGVALLFLVGEERNSAGAYHAAKTPRGSKFLINGEPTENKLAVGSKGSMRLEVYASGRMAHSAYPHLGDSAIDKLLDALAALRAIEMPADELLGASTLNIGVIQGGRAPNVVPDEAKAEIQIRIVDDGSAIRALVREAVKHLDIDAREILCIPAMRFGLLPGFETMVAAYTTDIPAFAGTWGQPFLLGPGSIDVAHTNEECVPKVQLVEAVEIYEQMARKLLS